MNFRIKLIATVVFVLVMLGERAFSQVDYPDDLNYPLSDSEINKIHVPANSCFHIAVVADSFSKKGDSVNASKSFLSVDPYYFLFLLDVPDSVEKFMRKQRKLTHSAINTYMTKLRKAYGEKKSDSYNTFGKMEKEDQAVRNRMDACGDSTCRSLSGKKMLLTDSLHFDYLYRYFAKNGWPTIKDGSLYASILAMHDHQHHEAYIPALKKAVRAGQVELYVLKYVNYWEREKLEYDHINDYIIRDQYFKFDISEAGYDKMPRNMDSIEQKVREICKYYYFYTIVTCESKGFDAYKKWESNCRTAKDIALRKVNLQIAYNNCRLSPEEIKVREEGNFWSVKWYTAEHADLKLFLYILFEKDNKGLKQFNKFIKEKKFITHPIYFEENKTAILPGDIDFLKKLVAWLQQNPLVKLEIDGHASNEGTDAANNKLSVARAEQVKKQLIFMGIDKNRLMTAGFGATKPLEPNDTEAGRAKNRRVEFTIMQ